MQTTITRCNSFYYQTDADVRALVEQINTALENDLVSYVSYTTGTNELLVAVVDKTIVDDYLQTLADER